MNEKERYAELVALTKNKGQWKDSIPFTASLLSGYPAKVTGKALWMPGEMGLLYPSEIRPFVEEIAAFLEAERVSQRAGYERPGTDWPGGLRTGQTVLGEDIQAVKG